MRKRKISAKRWIPPIIILLVLILLVSTIIYPTKTPENLRYCVVDSDCTCYDGCLCVNKKYEGAIACTQMATCTKFNYCECANNSCETRQNVRICDSSDECILVQDGCCSCNMGGKNTAINKEYLEWWNNKISSECKEIMCPAVISDDPTCSSGPRCVDGECTPVLKLGPFNP